MMSRDFCFSARFCLVFPPRPPMRSQGRSSVSSTSLVQKALQPSHQQQFGALLFGQWKAANRSRQHARGAGLLTVKRRWGNKLMLAAPGLAQVPPSCSLICYNIKPKCVQQHPSDTTLSALAPPSTQNGPSIDTKPLVKCCGQRRLVFTSAGPGSRGGCRHSLVFYSSGATSPTPFRDGWTIKLTSFSKYQ